MSHVEMPQNEINKIKRLFEGKVNQIFNELSGLKGTITYLSHDKVDVENFEKLQKCLYSILHEKIEEIEKCLKSLISNGKVTQGKCKSLHIAVKKIQEKLGNLKTAIDVKTAEIETVVDTLAASCINYDTLQNVIKTEIKGKLEILESIVDILAENSISMKKYKTAGTIIEKLLSAFTTLEDSNYLLKDQNQDLYEYCRLFIENNSRLQMFNNQYSQLEKLATLIGEKTHIGIKEQIMSLLNKMKLEHEYHSNALLEQILKRDQELFSSIENVASKIAEEILK